MTHASVDYGDLQEAVEKVVKDNFPAGDIVRVALREGADDDGERVFEITVVFDGPIDGIAERAPLSLLGDLRNTLGVFVDRGFPFLNFVPLSGLRI